MIRPDEFQVSSFWFQVSGYKPPVKNQPDLGMFHPLRQALIFLPLQIT
jgi:hypothetical protein